MVAVEPSTCPDEAAHLYLESSETFAGAATAVARSGAVLRQSSASLALDDYAGFECNFNRDRFTIELDGRADEVEGSAYPA